MKSKHALGLLIVILAATVAGAGGEIYGTIHTTDGRKLTGPIRWDRNENFWDDVLDGARTFEQEPKEEGFNLTIFGIQLFDSDSVTRLRGFSVPFGHLSSFERVGDEADVTLKSGEKIRVHSSSTDLGRAMRELLIDDVEQGSVGLSWIQLKKVEFRQSPDESVNSNRLHGTVATRSGSHTGFIVWNKNLSLTDDHFRGRAEGVDHAIPFADIRAIDVMGSTAKLTLANGETLKLRGHRGYERDSVDVVVPGFATVELVWDEVDRMTFSEAPPSRPYAAFDGGHKLAGTVTLADGGTVDGTITWDRDESFSWQELEGEQDGTSYAVLFEDIHSIERVSSEESRVLLVSEKVLVLSGSNDVDDSNRGVLVTDADANSHEFEWSDIKVIVFRR